LHVLTFHRKSKIPGTRSLQAGSATSCHELDWDNCFKRPETDIMKSDRSQCNQPSNIRGPLKAKRKSSPTK